MTKIQNPLTLILSPKGRGKKGEILSPMREAREEKNPNPLSPMMPTSSYPSPFMGEGRGEGVI
ncbi:MAG: hypothetical protein HY887_05935 [Deltaproteobacteria bacterium]|nr:hypothetical protein [Deltaproteobacteria bacterium]